jgi:anti-sigma B factor antagonist
MSHPPREALFPFEIRLLERDDTAFLQVRGELDVERSEQFRKEFAAVPETADELVLDLRETTFIDSTGIGLVLEAWKFATGAKRSFSVLATNGHVNRSLATAGVDRLLPIVHEVSLPRTEEHAVLDD